MEKNRYGYQQIRKDKLFPVYNSTKINKKIDALVPVKTIEIWHFSYIHKYKTLII